MHERDGMEIHSGMGWNEAVGVGVQQCRLEGEEEVMEGGLVEHD